MSVDKMLSELTPGEFNEWLAAYAVGLDIEGWAQATTVATSAQNELAMVNAALQKRQPTRKDFKDQWDFLPAKYKELIGTPDKQQSAESIGNALKAAYGNHRKSDS